ncbi:hypothetical protein U91I_02412 [alpha proteobacterium U9-1i]|nr:hypothetical protein U91I_02412 [alpha proteobacterium U9-1i]
MIDAAQSQTAERQAIERSLLAFLIAAGVGAISLLSPPLSFLLIALLGAHALLQSGSPRIDAWSCAGPILAALLVGAFVGVAGAVGVLFVWRLFADTRWSQAEADRLALTTGAPAPRNLMTRAHLWLSPLYGLTLVAFTAPHMVAGLPLDLPHLPMLAPMIAALLLAAGLFDWGMRCAVSWRLGELAPAPAMHLLTHHAIFIVAFGLGLDVSAGIVAMMAWRLAYAAPLRIQANLTAVP